MNSMKHFFRLSASFFVLALSACSNAPTNSTRPSDGSSSVESPRPAVGESRSVVSTAQERGNSIGSRAGCAVSRALGGECETGASIGSGIGSIVGTVVGTFVGWYFDMRKTREAQSINEEYAQSKTKGTLKPPKDAIMPAAFTAEISEGALDEKGQKEILITANTDLIGYGDRIPEISQRYAIFDEKKKLIEQKTVKLTAINGAGRYQTVSKFKLPANAKGKKFIVKTELVSNGKVYKNKSYKIAASEASNVLILALAR